MVRVQNTAEHSLFADPPKPVVLPAAASTKLIDNQVGDKSGEIAFRYVQNCGANDIYYTLGMTSADNINYHGIISPYGQLDISNHRLSVYGYSVGGSTAAITVIRRADLTHHN
jgi:hypothetical protein